MLTLLTPPMAASFAPMPAVRAASRLHFQPSMLTPISDETKARLLAGGFAVPGMADQAPKLQAARECTAELPCPFDGNVAWELFSKMALTPGPVLLLLVFAYSVGVQAFGAEDGSNPDEDSWLVKQAERSRARRQERLRDLSARIKPVQDWFGWNLVDEKSGNPTVDAYVFLALAVAVQIAAVYALSDAVLDAFS